uniref:Uncharacterized protein n=1 Tax=Knipowitschia caucasica TaxID=637954 RepID=A0AAV2LKT9_KNICA
MAAVRSAIMLPHCKEGFLLVNFIALVPGEFFVRQEGDFTGCSASHGRTQEYAAPEVLPGRHGQKALSLGVPLRLLRDHHTSQRPRR